MIILAVEDANIRQRKEDVPQTTTCESVVYVHDIF